MAALGVGQPWATSRTFEPAFLVPLGMLAFGLLLFTVSFWLEVRKSRPLLVRLLQLRAVPAA